MGFIDTGWNNSSFAAQPMPMLSYRGDLVMWQEKLSTQSEYTNHWKTRDSPDVFGTRAPDCVLTVDPVLLHI